MALKRKNLNESKLIRFSGWQNEVGVAETLDWYKPEIIVYLSTTKELKYFFLPSIIETIYIPSANDEVLTWR